MSLENASGIPEMPISPHASLPKRTTCDACRHRKVRCDRTKPECLRCAKSGQTCTYASKSADSAKVNKVLQELHNRLRHAERKLQESTFSGPAIESNSENSPGFIHDDNMSMSDLGALAVELGFTTAEDHALYALDQPMFDDFTSTFLPVRTPPGPLLDDFGIGAEETVVGHPNPALGIHRQTLHASSSVDEAGVPSGAATPNPGTFQIPPNAYHRLVDAYFKVIQKHLPLVNEEEFITSPISYPKHQIQALRSSVCMAGSNVCDDLRHLEHHCYIAARWHLEQAELEVQGSSVLSLEAAQALVLVARHEINHFRTPRAYLTLNRLTSNMKILRFDRIDDTWGRPGPERSNQSPPPPQLEGWRRTYLISLSLKHHIASLYPPQAVEDGFEGDGSSKLQLGDKPQNLNSACQTQIETFDPFSLFCFSLNFAAETDRHQRLTKAEAEDSAPPSFNFCRNHSRLELEIGALVSTLTTSSPGSAMPSGLDSELRVLAILTALGARIQLIRTTILHGRNAKFLEPIFAECRKQNVSTAEDIGEVLTQANVLDPERIRAFREASLYIMPPLVLAAETLLLLIKETTFGCDSGTRPHTQEIRQSLEIIYKVMSVCKDDTTRYDSCIARSRTALEKLQPGMQFRTEFTSFACASDTSSPQRGKVGQEAL